jgi:2-phospho-L-lactate guanylyltransferase (CobY/MobA/RfbA family)
LPGIALDVDNPEDLRQLLTHPGKTRTQSLIRQWALDGRLPATGTESV